MREESTETAPDPERVLQRLLEERDADGLRAWIDDVEPEDLIHGISALPAEERLQLLSLVPPEDAASVLSLLPETQAVESFEKLPSDAAADILHEFPSDEQADFVAEIRNPDEILSELDPDEAADIRTLTSWPGDVAGGLMVTEFLSFQEDATVSDVVAQLQDQAEQGLDEDVQYAYVVDASRRIKGVLRIRDLLFSPRSRRVRALMIPDPICVAAETPLDQLESLFDLHGYIALPVVDDEQHLLGVVRRDAVESERADRSEGENLRRQGIVGGEELRSMPLHVRCRRRLTWLSLNVVLNIVAATVIALHQETLEALIALAVFLPIISDMSGCSGNQAVAVSMRELALNIARPRDAARVLRQELTVGLVNGLALGLLLGCAAWAWQGNPWLGLVVGGALMLNTLLAVALGGVIPLLLKALRVDPALASGPLLTTVTDMCGFLLLLSLAGAAMSHLT